MDIKLIFLITFTPAKGGNTQLRLVHTRLFMRQK